MADNILDAAACHRESPQAAKRMRLEDGSSVPRLYSQQTLGLSNHGEVLEGLNRLRLNSTLCDVILCCEGQEVPCHRSVLASISSYFKAMFTSNMVESTQERVTIRGVEPQMIGLLVNYAYTSKVSISTDNVQDLLAASDLLEVTAVREACDRYIMHHMDSKLGTQSDGTSVPLSSLAAKMFVDPKHPKKVLEGLNRLRLNSTFCDVILCCEGQEVPCHRYVLASISSYFEAMFTSGMVESTQERVTIRGVEPHMIGLMVDYAYTCEVYITKTITKTGVISSNVQDLIAASDLFDITAVRDACCEDLQSDVNINNCVEIYRFAEAHSCEGLKKHSMDYILEDFSVIHLQEEFLSLPVERLIEILSSDHLNVPKEDMVFDAAMLWLDRCPTRKQSFEQVLDQIRLPLISPSYLHTVVERLDVVKEHQGCQRFISEAKERPYLNPARQRRTTVIVTLGANFTSDGFNKVMSFDPLANQWKTLGRVPMKGNQFAVVASGSTLYLAGGGQSRETWRYDVFHNSWLKLAPMNEPRCNFKLVMLDGYMFAVGGWNRESDHSMERYDPNTDTWQLMESVGFAARFDLDRCVVALDGHLYFMGARWPNPGQVAKYNPITSVWTAVTPMQIPRNKSAACVLNGKIYLIGGQHNYNNITIANTVECYNPKTNQWTMCAPMQVERVWPRVAVVDGKIYVLGGRDAECYLKDSRASNIECYCEETDTWETVGKMDNDDYFTKNTIFQFVSLKLRRSLSSHDDDSEGD